MKLLKNKVLTSSLLALVFSVAVSGGCGGGGGHYSGNFGGSGDSSENTTPEDFTIGYVSQDVLEPTPDEPALSDQFASENADDEYGATGFNRFISLHKTLWSIDQLAIHVSNDIPCNIVEDYYSDLNTGKTYSKDVKIAFLISGNNMDTMTWATQDDKKNPNFYDLSVKFKDTLNSSDVVLTAPILRSSKNFVDIMSSIYYQASITDNRSLGNGIESIIVGDYFTDTSLVAKQILVTNQFTLTGKQYKSLLTLSRVDHFSILDQTDWQIKSINVIGLVKDTSSTDNEYENGKPENYQVIKRDKVNKITLRTSFKNNVGVLKFIIDDKNKSEPLIATFKDLTINQKLRVPFLRPASSFQIDNEYPVEACKAFKADVNTGTLPGREVMYISNYGPNGDLTICNSVCYYDKNKKPYHYWATLVLEPYNPNKK